jgi:hypothetical protein
LWLYACKCCIFHLINYSQNVGTLWLEFVFLHCFSWTMCKKNIININNKTKKNWTIFLFTHTPVKHHNKTLFMKNLNSKCDKNKYKSCQIFIFKKMQMRLRIKIFPSKLYPFMIDVCFKHWNTSCTLPKIVQIIQSLENLDFLKQYNYL